LVFKKVFFQKWVLKKRGRLIIGVVLYSGQYGTLSFNLSFVKTVNWRWRALIVALLIFVQFVNLDLSSAFLSPPQYFYDAQTQQYLYWDTEKQTYAPAPAASDATADQAAAASSAGPTTPPSKEDKEAKEKKDKPKNKSAQQVPLITVAY